MKKIITVILIVILAFSSLSVSAGAETTKTADTTDISGIISALNAVEPVKEQMGLSDVDFYELTYSDSISAYDYTKDGLVFNCEFIPIKHDGTLVGWVIRKTADGETYYQFTTAFADKVNRIADSGTEFAIIYGYDVSYLYDGKEIYTIGSVLIPVEGRWIIESVKQLEDKRAVLRSVGGSYPIYASFKHMKGSHAGVVYAVNIMVGYFYVMDPLDGFCNGTYSPKNVHMYVSPSTGLAMTLEQASCMYWE